MASVKVRRPFRLALGKEWRMPYPPFRSPCGGLRDGQSANSWRQAQQAAAGAPISFSPQTSPGTRYHRFQIARRAFCSCSNGKKTPIRRPAHLSTDPGPDWQCKKSPRRLPASGIPAAVSSADSAGSLPHNRRSGTPPGGSPPGKSGLPHR